MRSQTATPTLDVSKVASHWHDFFAPRPISLEHDYVLRTRDPRWAIRFRRYVGRNAHAPAQWARNSEAIGQRSNERRVFRQEGARSLAPALVSRIPLIPHKFIEDDHSAILMTVAGGGLLEAQVMATTTGAQLNLAIQTVSTSLLSEWNPKPEFDSKPVAANYLLREWLDHPLGPARRIPDVLRHLLHDSPDCPVFRYDGKDYPNPYAFFTRLLHKAWHVVVTRTPTFRVARRIAEQSMLNTSLARLSTGSVGGLSSPTVNLNRTRLRLQNLVFYRANACSDRKVMQLAGLLLIS